MAYTAAQLRSMFSNVHIGLAPSAAQGAALDQVAQYSANGSISDASALSYVVNTADADTAVALQSYQFFTGKTPTAAGLSYLVNSTANTTDLNDAYYQGFNLENRYINFAQNLGILGEGATAFQATYSPLTFAQAVSTAYETIIGSAQATAAGIDPIAAKADIAGRLGYFQQVAAQRLPGVSQDLAVKAAVVGYIMAEAIKADVGLYAAGVNAFLGDLAPDNFAQFNNDMVLNYAIPAGGMSPPGHVISLTTGLDIPGAAAPLANTQGTSGSDVFLADQTTLSTDGLNGGAGADTLLLTNNGAAAYTAAPTLNSIETIQLFSVGAGGTTLDLANASGLTTVALRGLGAGANDVSAVGSISIINAPNNLTVTADVDNAGSGATLTVGLKTDTATDALTVVLRNTDTGGVATTQGLVSLTANGVEALTITGASAVIPGTAIDPSDTLSIATITDTAATSLTLNGDSAISLGSTASSLTALATIDASAMTKGVTLGTLATAFSTAAAGADITTGSGNDFVSLNVGLTGALKAVNLGGGVDTLALSGGPAAAGLTIVDLSSQTDQISQLQGGANAAAQIGVENVDLHNLAGAAQITGNAGINIIVGTAGNDVITGAGGADVIDVQGGVDTLVYTLAGQTGAGLSANGVFTSVDVVTGMGVGDHVNLAGLGAGFNSVAATADGVGYLSGLTGVVGLTTGTYVAATGGFTAGAGPDLAFQWDTNGAAAGGLEAVVLIGSNAAISSVSSDANGVFTFA